jgi:arsenical pump membrane protein
VPITIAYVALTLLRGEHESAHPHERPPFVPRLGTAGVVSATVLVLVLARPAPWVLALGIVVAVLTRTSPRAANPPLLLGVLALAVLLGWAARGLHAQELLEHAGRWETAWVAAGAALLINNLPAAVVLSAHVPPHPRALLLGLDLGPNLAVTGSLSAIFWLQVARANGARPSIRRYTLLGAVLMPVTLVAALVVTARA